MTNRSVQYLSWMFFFYGIKFTFVTLLWNASGIWGVSFLVGWLRDGSLSVTSVTVEWTLSRVMTDTLQYLSVYAPEIIRRRLNGQKKIFSHHRTTTRHIIFTWMMHFRVGLQVFAPFCWNHVLHLLIMITIPYNVTKIPCCVVTASLTKERALFSPSSPNAAFEFVPIKLKFS